MKGVQQPHQSEGFQPHVQQIFLPAVALIQHGEGGDLVADL
jgi:hypothetical protein